MVSYKFIIVKGSRHFPAARVIIQEVLVDVTVYCWEMHNQSHNHWPHDEQ